MPVITTPTRAAIDYLSEPENCIWVESKNSESVSKAIEKLLDSNNLRSEIKIRNLKKGAIFSKAYVAIELSETILSAVNQYVCRTPFEEAEK
jgi:glycosyltransferase involved in cell wall biosynthesis